MRGSEARRRTELLRKAIHVGCGALAFLLRWLTWPQALALAAAALLGNLLALPKLVGRRLHREHELGAHSAGILLYPASVVALLLLFRERIWAVAAGWTLMAFGDGMASVVGTLAGRHPLPWNERKSVEGFVAFLVFGGAATAGVLLWMRPADYGLAALLAAAAVATMASAVLESLPTGIDDNLVVPMAGAAVTFGMLELSRPSQLDGRAIAARTVLALAACAVLAVLAVRRGSLTRAGAVAAAAAGTFVVAGASWVALLVLVAFFALGTLATRAGARVKEARGIAEARGGRRSVANVVANGGFAAACAPLVLVADPVVARAAAVALAGAVATAAFDTVSSEIGKAWGRRTVLPTTLRRVPPGTEGAVSLEGTLAGLAAAAVIALVALVPPGLPSGTQASVAIVAGAFVGSSFESVAGAWLQATGRTVDNHALNLANTVVGGVAAAFLDGLAWNPSLAGSLVRPLSFAASMNAASPAPRTGLPALARDFARPFTLLAPWLGFLSSGIAGLGTLPAEHARELSAWMPVLVGSLMAATLNAASNTLNQIYDRDIDALNKPQRPLPSGRASLRVAWILALVFYAAALVMAWLADPPPGVPGSGRHQCFVIVLVAAFLTWAYSAPPLRTKRLGWIANLTIAVPRGMLLKVAGWSAAVDILHVEPWYVGLVFGLFLLGATTTKDFADIEGDRAGGCRTLPVVLGPERAARVTVPFFIVPFLLIPLGALAGILTGNVVALVILGLGMATYGAWIARLMLRDPASLAIDDNHPSWKHMYIMMFVGQIGFAVAYWL